MLLTFIQDARTKIRAVLASRPARGDEWLTERNENIQTVLRVLDEFVNDVRNSGIILRFDQAATGNVLARYTEGENTLHVRAVQTPDDLRVVLPNVLHEYTHAKQDRAAAALLVAGRAPREHTREAELQKETEARLVDVYATELLNRAKLAPRDPNVALNAILGSVGFRVDFERMRTGSAAERRAGAAGIRQRLAGPYAPQLATNAPAIRYPIEITQSNRATLFRRGARGAPEAVDLGPIPATVTMRQDLINHLAGALYRLPSFGALFTRPSGGSYVVAIFFAFFRDVNGRDQPVVEFNLGPPAAPAAAPAPAPAPAPHP
jgi:hypothetical protein